MAEGRQQKLFKGSLDPADHYLAKFAGFQLCHWCQIKAPRRKKKTQFECLECCSELGKAVPLCPECFGDYHQYSKGSKKKQKQNFSIVLQRRQLSLSSKRKENQAESMKKQPSVSPDQQLVKRIYRRTEQFSLDLQSAIQSVEPAQLKKFLLFTLTSTLFQTSALQGIEQQKQMMSKSTEKAAFEAKGLSGVKDIERAEEGKDYDDLLKRTSHLHQNLLLMTIKGYTIQNAEKEQRPSTQD